jgi:UDP-N-acetylglucosamine/UDP-N-acetylgalactosamine diphosphorylase
MKSRTKDELLAKLADTSPSQQHLLAFWDELDDAARERLSAQIRSVDLDLIAQLFRGADDGPDWHELAARAEPPRAFRLDGACADFSPQQARERGEAALRDGKLAMILVAGGQGARLGFHHPKGMYPLGPVSRRTLFQILFERLLAVGRRYGVRIPLYLMTSPATHEETLRFLDQHDRFGLRPDDLRVFCQGTMPAIDAATGKLLLADKDSLFLAPDGHGGTLAALDNSGCLQDAQQRGVEQFFYGQVDNSLTQICDACLVGYHFLAGSEMTTQVVEKSGPSERVGNVVSIDGQVRIIEYIHLPKESAERRNADGSLRLWAGNLAVHVFDAAFLDRMSQRADALPFHRAKKPTPFVNADGQLVEPKESNAIKFERFIFDLLPFARNAIVVEADKSQAFAPVKNADREKVDTPATAQAAMIQLHQQWLRCAGAVVADEVPVEISDLFALDAEELAQKIKPGLRVTEPTYFH